VSLQRGCAASKRIASVLVFGHAFGHARWTMKETVKFLERRDLISLAIIENDDEIFARDFQRFNSPR